MGKFNIKEFLTENKLTEVSRRLNEATEVRFNELTDEQQQKARQIAKAFGSEHIRNPENLKYHTGVFGQIMTFYHNSHYKPFRFSNDLMRDLLRADIRWAQPLNEKEVAIGF